MQLGPLLRGQLDPKRLRDGRRPSCPKLYDTYLRKCLGAVWAVWHLPLFFVPGSQRDLGFPAFLLATIIMRVVLTWVFNGTGGSVLVVSLLHQATNVVTDVLGPYAVPADRALNQWLSAALRLGAAVILGLVTGPARLSRRPASGGPPTADPPPATGARVPAPV